MAAAAGRAGIHASLTWRCKLAPSRAERVSCVRDELLEQTRTGYRYSITEPVCSEPRLLARRSKDPDQFFMFRSAARAQSPRAGSTSPRNRSPITSASERRRHNNCLQSDGWSRCMLSLMDETKDAILGFGNAYSHFRLCCRLSRPRLQGNATAAHVCCRVQ